MMSLVVTSYSTNSSLPNKSFTFLISSSFRFDSYSLVISIPFIFWPRASLGLSSSLCVASASCLRLFLLLSLARRVFVNVLIALVNEPNSILLFYYFSAFANIFPPFFIHHLLLLRFLCLLVPPSSLAPVSWSAGPIIVIGEI